MLLIYAHSRFHFHPQLPPIGFQTASNIYYYPLVVVGGGGVLFHFECSEHTANSKSWQQQIATREVTNLENSCPFICLYLYIFKYNEHWFALTILSLRISFTERCGNRFDRKIATSYSNQSMVWNWSKKMNSKFCGNINSNHYTDFFDALAIIQHFLDFRTGVKSVQSFNCSVFTRV